MTARRQVPLSAIRSQRVFGLLFLCVALLLAVTPVASQDGEELPPHEAAPPREAAVLEVTVSPQPDLSADLGETATCPLSSPIRLTEWQY
ncbi:MAG: hypothetical protein KIT52_12980 [Anaerolineae bacterium]|nr:hypothetical protein [Anaerolineae bacterium]